MGVKRHKEDVGYHHPEILESFLGLANLKRSNKAVLCAFLFVEQTASIVAYSFRSSKGHRPDNLPVPESRSASGDRISSPKKSINPEPVEHALGDPGANG